MTNEDVLNDRAKELMEMTVAIKWEEASYYRKLDFIGLAKYVEKEILKERIKIYTDFLILDSDDILKKHINKLNEQLNALEEL